MRTSVIMARGLSCFESYRVFQEEGIEPVSPALAAGFLSSILSFISIYKRKRILHMTLPQSGKNLKSFYFSLPSSYPLHTFSLSLLLSFFLFFLPVYLFEETKLFVMSNVQHSGFCSSISMISVMSVTHFFLPLYFL